MVASEGPCKMQGSAEILAYTSTLQKCVANTEKLRQGQWRGRQTQYSLYVSALISGFLYSLCTSYPIPSPFRKALLAYLRTA